MNICYIGVGGQGCRAVAELIRSGSGVCSLMIDNSYENRKGNTGRYLYIPFRESRNSWNRDEDFREWIGEEENREKLKDSLKGFDMLAVICAAGGEMTYPAMDLLKFVQKKMPDKKAILIFSLPFRRESSFWVNYRAGLLYDYIRSSPFACCVLENERLGELLGDQGNAYSQSHMFLAYIAQGMMEIIKDTGYVVRPGLLVYEEFLYEYSNQKITEQEIFPVLGYETAGRNAAGRMTLGGRTLPVHLNEVCYAIEKRVGHPLCIYENEEGMPQDRYLFRVVSEGKETERHRIRRRELRIMDGRGALYVPEISGEIRYYGTGGES